MSLYEDIGVTPDATEAQIKAAGRKAQKQHHPDKGGKQEDFVRVSTALKVLLDPARRAEYDRTGNADTGSQEDAERAAATAMVAGFMNEVMAGDPRYTNIPEMIKSRIERLKIESDGQLAAAASAHSVGLAKLKSFAKRMKRSKDGEDILKGMLDAHTTAIDRQHAQEVAQHAYKGRVIAQALAMVGGYEYEADANPPADLYGSGQGLTSDMILKQVRRMHEAQMFRGKPYNNRF